MDNAKVLIYDGSFNGFLTTVFVAFEEKLTVSNIQKNSGLQRGLFSEPETVSTQMDKAKRVWNGIHKKSHEAIKNIYFAFQSEAKGIEMLLYRYILKMFHGQGDSPWGHTDDISLKIGQWAKMVGREKQRMEAFAQFQLTKDQIYFAVIGPDFDVLPLISKHFRYKYPHREWVIYDFKRDYGLFYDGESVEMIPLELEVFRTNSIQGNAIFANEEQDYRQLWNDFFKNTHIRSYIHQKLHAPHVSGQYWGYLNERRAV
jgi:probable DNA metabolism protein